MQVEVLQGPPGGYPAAMTVSTLHSWNKEFREESYERRTINGKRYRYESRYRRSLCQLWQDGAAAFERNCAELAGRSFAQQAASWRLLEMHFCLGLDCNGQRFCRIAEGRTSVWP